MHGRRGRLGLALIVAAFGGSVAWAAQQTLDGRLFMVKNPNPLDAAKRKVVYFAKEFTSTNTIVGDPSVAGATLRVTVDSSTQCFVMPSSGWSAIGAGFKYKDPTGSQGPVKVAFIKKTARGVFLNKVVALGKFGTGPQPHVTLVPPNPGVQGDTNFRIAGGDEYCASYPASLLSPNTDKTFKVKSTPAPAGCTVSACSPSGAFLDKSAAPF